MTTRTWRLADGTEVRLRPIRPDDARIEADFVRKLSPRSKYFRFLHSLPELTPEMVARFTQVDYTRDMALIATVEQDGAEIEIAVARYVLQEDGKTCEFAIVVADEWQRQGIGATLMRELIGIARDRDLEVMVGEVLSENTAMLRFVRGLGFRAGPGDDPSIQIVRRVLQDDS